MKDSFLTHVGERMLSESDIAEPVLQRLYSVWDRCRRDGDMPSRQEMDLPFSISFALPKVSLIDVLWQNDRPRYRYRLIGSEIVELIGQNCTGRYLDEVFSGEDAFTARLFGWLNEVAQGGSPHYTTIEYPWQSIRQFSRLSLPLRDEKEENRVGCILAGIEARRGDADFESYHQTRSRS